VLRVGDAVSALFIIYIYIYMYIYIYILNQDLVEGMGSQDRATVQESVVGSELMHLIQSSCLE